MTQVNNCFLFLATLMLLNHTVRPWEFSPVEDNVIMKTEANIRFIIQQLVEIFGIASQTRQMIERYLRVHAALARAALAAAGDWPELRRRATADVPASMADQLPPAPPHDPHLLVRIVHAFLQHVEANKNVHGDDMNLDAYLQNELILNYTDSDEAYADAFDESSENDTDDDEFWTPKNITIDTRRIFGSLPTTIRRFPFMASITMFEQFHCAGVIIASDLVITAASGVQLAYNNRFYRENPSFLSVRVGSTYHAVGGEAIAVNEIYFHPSYNPKTLSNNICVLRLVRHIRFRNKRSRDKRVKKIDFDKRDSPLPNNTPEVLILGWGAKNSANKIGMEGNLRYSRLNVYSPRDCQDIYSKEFVTIHHFCAGYVSKGGGACNQDVGDPGIINGLLHGIVSFGAPVCGAPDSPTVFTKVGFYADWIETIMEQKAPVGLKRTSTTTQYAIVLDNEERQFNENRLTLSSFGKILPLVIREYPTKKPYEYDSITEQDETTTDDFDAGRTVDNQEDDMTTFVKKQVKKTTTTIESYDLYDSPQSMQQDDDYTTVKYTDPTTRHTKTKQRIKKFKHTTQKTTTVVLDIENPLTSDPFDYEVTEKNYNKNPSKTHIHDDETFEDYEHDSIQITKKKRKIKNNKPTKQKIDNIHNDYEPNIYVTPEFQEENRETTSNTTPKLKKNKLKKPFVKIDKKLNEIYLHQQKTTKKNRIHNKLLHNIRDLTGSKKVHLEKKNAGYSYNQAEVTPFNNNFTPEEEKPNLQITDDVEYSEKQSPVKTSKEIYAEKLNQNEKLNYNEDVEDGSRIFESQPHKQVKKPNRPKKQEYEAKYVSVKPLKTNHETSTSENLNRDLQMYDASQEPENEDYQLKFENDSAETYKNYDLKMPDIPHNNEYDSEADLHHDYVTSGKYQHINHQKQRQKKRPFKINDFGRHEIMTQNPNKKRQTTKSKRPKDLGRLNSHELKQMFLEQISKQKNTQSQKPETNVPSQDNQDSANNIQVKFMDLDAENNKQSNKEGGFYDLLKSAFNKIQSL